MKKPDFSCILTVKMSHQEPKVYQLHAGERLIIGRDRHHAQVVVHDDTVSGQHCEFIHSGDSIVVHDLGSSNGTFLRAKRIVGSTAVQSGDVIRAGNATLTISCKYTATQWIKKNRAAVMIAGGVIALMIGGLFLMQKQATHRRVFGGSGGGMVNMQVHSNATVNVATFMPASGQNTIDMNAPSIENSDQGTLNARTVHIFGSFHRNQQ